jgi:hypothetical protein
MTIAERAKELVKKTGPFTQFYHIMYVVVLLKALVALYLIPSQTIIYRLLSTIISRTDTNSMAGIIIFTRITDGNAIAE